MNMNPQKLHHDALCALQPAMRYDGTQPLTEWQTAARAKLAQLLGLDRITPAADDRFLIESETDCGTYTDYRFTFQSEEGYSLPCHLWIPKGKDGKIPMVICLQGHSTGFHISMGKPKYPNDEATISGGDRDFACQIVREGFCALAIEQRCFGECGGTERGPGCTVPTLDALLFGRTTIGERVFDTGRAIDMVLAHFPQVDSEAIACMGNSGGGTATIYAAAIEERIAVAMPSCALCTYKDSIGAMAHCACNFVPNIALSFDMGDLCGLIAPRKLIAVSGATDSIFPHDGVAQSMEVLQKYYDAAGVPNNCAWVEGPEGHRFYAALSWPVFHRMLGQ